MGYDDLAFKIPEQCDDYAECSAFVTTSIEEIMQAAIDSGKNQIIINTNLKLGLPMEFKKQRKVESSVTTEVDVKATSEDFESSGKSPNITSFKRIRTAYVEDPNYLFVILSLRHRVYSTKNEKSGLMDGIMEVVAHNAYDLKLLSSSDVGYNPALGTGQIQVKDIHYVTLTERTTWEFCQLLDKKFINSRNGFEKWLELATSNSWIKTDE